jgi:hypothetical protein
MEARMHAERRAVEIGVRDEARGAVRVVSREGTRHEARGEMHARSSDQLQLDANADEHAPPNASEASVEPARVDPALAGRELGPWTMVPAAVTVPVAIVLAALLAWYFARLGRAEVPRGRRRLRRASIACALVALVPLVRALTFVHPHEDRVGWAVSWSIVLFALAGWATLAVVDFVLVARSGLREYDALRRETFGAPRDGRGGGDGKEPRGG